MTQMQGTSLNAYAELEKKGLALTQEAVLDTIELYGTICNNEIAKILCWEINRVTGRVNELVKLGILEAKEKRPSRVTGRLSIAWGLK